MLQGNVLSDVIQQLRSTADENLRLTCVDILSVQVDWAAATRDFLAAVADNLFLGGTRKIFVEGVEPKTLLLHEEPGRFRLVLNHFDKSSFLAHQRDGRITPHYHHFDFATRVISGSYHHLLFSNNGDLARPRLALRHRTRDDAGHVYVLPWDEFHCVLAPAPDTMSLQIRSPARCRPDRRPLTMTAKDLLAARDAALVALDDLPVTSESGLVPEFARCWL